MRHRYARPLIVLSILLISPWLFIGGPHYTDPPLYRSLWDAGHLVFFGLLGVGLALHLRINGWPQWLGLSALALGLGLAIELVQHVIGRDFTLTDVGLDLAGFWLGLLLPQVPSPRVWRLRLLALLLIAPLLWHIGQQAQRHWRAVSQFPIINDFETAADLARLSGQLTDGRLALQHHTVNHGKYALAIRLTRARYSGASLDTLLGDWRGYQTLAMALYNPDQTPLTLTLRIADREHNNAYHDRFNHQLLLAPGWNNIALPLADIASAPRRRMLDLSAVTDITLFSVSTPEPRTVYWDYVRLE